MKNQIFFALSAAVAVLGMPSSAPAQEFPTVRISVADLNLLAPSDKAVLVRRIKAAVDQVCGSREISPDLNTVVERGKCRTSARIGADRQAAALTERRRVIAAMQDKSGNTDGTAVASR